jgi:hypothetical protein
MSKMSEIAIRECVAELSAGSRRPIDASAVDTLVGWLRPNFEKILDRLDGPRRWAEHGERLRENSRHLGTLADFFGSHAGVDMVGVGELSNAMKLVRADCTVRAERTPLGFQYCPTNAIDPASAEVFLRSLTASPELACRVG